MKLLTCDRKINNDKKQLVSFVVEGNNQQLKQQQLTSFFASVERALQCELKFQI